MLALTTLHRWPLLAVGAVAPAWLAVLQWQTRTDLAVMWPRLLALSATLYAVFAVYPFVVGRRVRDSRDPYLAAVLASAMAFFGARTAFIAGGLDWMIGVIPVIEGAILALMLRSLLSLESRGQRDLGRLALVAGAALAFVTVAIPLQLKQQWITIGWALEGAALAWVYKRIPHRGLFYSSIALLGAVFVRLALNPEVLVYEPRGSMRILNWYLYAYILCAAAMFVAGWFLSKTNDRLAGSLRVSSLLPGAGVVLLFLLLNIEIADFYATGSTIMFRFGVTVAQDLTYTIGWLVFGMGLLTAGIFLGNRPARVAAVTLIAVTTFKCFLYDLARSKGCLEWRRSSAWPSRSRSCRSRCRSTCSGRGARCEAHHAASRRGRADARAVRRPRAAGRRDVLIERPCRDHGVRATTAGHRFRTARLRCSVSSVAPWRELLRRGRTHGSPARHGRRTSGTAPLDSAAGTHPASGSAAAS